MHPLQKNLTIPLAGLTLGVMLLGLPTQTRAQDTNEKLGILPVDQKKFGRTYGDWGGLWWKWAIGVPGAANPVLDETGEFGHVDQNGPVWFLAGTFGEKAERTVTVPSNKWLFFPLRNTVWWAPEDVAFATFLAEEYLMLDPEELTDEELIRLAADFSMQGLKVLTCTIDSVKVEDPEQYRASSDTFKIIDTDLFDDFEVPISKHNSAIADGYWILLAPLSPGKHVISFTAEQDSNPVVGAFKVEVKYNITVK